MRETRRQVNPHEHVRVLIVDDSALIRKVLADLLRSAPEIEVVGTARDGDEAIRLAASLRPDVVTLDVEMPGRSGLEILPELLAVHPASVLMISSHTKAGADVTLAALERGAVDFYPKPDRFQLAQLRESCDQLVGKVLTVAHCRSGRRGRNAARDTASLADASAAARLPIPPATHRAILIGISTGGPQALGAVLPLLNPPIPPILIVQHMPGTFTNVFAERLNRACVVTVKEAEDGDRIESDRVLIAPGGRHMAIAGLPPKARITLDDSPPVSGHKPSIDVLFKSAARVYQAGAVGIIMTGMGRDGAEGCKHILAAGGITFGQDEATSAVYGMNKAAFQAGAVSAQFPLEKLPGLIKRFSPAT